MNRRNFLGLLGLGAGGVLLDQAIPFGRVWSFPSKIVIPKYERQFLITTLPLTLDEFALQYIQPAARQFFSEWEKDYLQS